MSRVALAVPVAAALIASTVVLPAQQQPVFRAATDVVPVNVSVMRGRTPVTGLGASDFELTDNGVRQQIDAVSVDGQPVDITIAMGAMPRSEIAQLERGVDASNRMFAMLRPDDRLRMVDAGGDIRQTAMGAPGPLPASHEIVPTAGLSLNDGLFLALAWPIDPNRRHLVVVFTNGDDNWSTLDADRLPDIASRSDAVLHAVLYNALPEAQPSSMSKERINNWRQAYRALDAAVRRTGGLLHVIADRAAGFERVLADFRSSYLLRYTPRGVPASGWHRIEVKVTRAGSFDIRARQGYER